MANKVRLQDLMQKINTRKEENVEKSKAVPQVGSLRTSNVLP